MTQEGLAEEAKAEQGIIRAEPLFHNITSSKYLLIVLKKCISTKLEINNQMLLTDFIVIF